MAQPQIQPLSCAPAALEQLALWHHRECLRQGLESSLERRRAYLAKHLGPEPLPFTLVALDAKAQPLGCVSLVRYSSAASPHPRVWLSNLYVVQAHRRLGLGQALLDRALEGARQLNLDQLWLFTDQRIDYYRHRGWQTMGEARLGGSGVRIMNITLSSPGQS